MHSPLPSSRLVDQLRANRFVPDIDRYDQHLLYDDSAVDLFLSWAGLHPSDTALDVGAGPGTIAAHLAAYARRVIAIELDERFAPLLNTCAARHPNLEVIWGDLLQVDWPRVDVVVANPPFDRTEPLIARLRRTPARTVVLATSPDFVRAATADVDSPSFGRTSVYVQTDFHVDRVVGLPAAAFWPAPSRDPMLVRLCRRAAPSTRMRRLADALERRGELRVRDLAARIRLDHRSLALRPQKRLQALTNSEIACLVRAVRDSNTSTRPENASRPQ